MEQTLFKIMWTSAPAISSIIGVIVLTAWVTVKLTRFYARFEKNERILFETVTRTDNIESRLNRIEAKLDFLVDLFSKWILKGPDLPQS